MRWNQRDPMKWRLRFAIYPVMIWDRWVWLEFYMSRKWGALTDRCHPGEEF